MSSVNKVILIGRLGRDPEIRHSDTGKRIGNFSLATSEKWTDKSGERQERTEWHRVVIFNDHLCGIVEKYLTKGSQVYVEGSLQTRTWKDHAIERNITEVVLGNFNGTLTMLGGGNEGSPQAVPPPVIENEMVDDEIVF